jgi:hypothetical protein
MLQRKLQQRALRAYRLAGRPKAGQASRYGSALRLLYAPRQVPYMARHRAIAAAGVGLTMQAQGSDGHNDGMQEQLTLTTTSPMPGWFFSPLASLIR